MRRFTAIAAVVLAAVAAAPATAPAAGRLVIKGAGWGHGIGMSQYGTFGFAQHGWDYKRILRHYYSGTEIKQVSPDTNIRVLLQSGRRAVFSGAVAAGERRLSAGRTYSASVVDGRIALRSASGRTLERFDAPLRVASPRGGSARLHGPAANGTRDGRYRGALEIHAVPGGVQTINVVGLEDYIRGVVSAESPSSWPAEALKAQSVAARSYAVTTDAGSRYDAFTAYADTRSQMYTGVRAEYPSTDAAVRDTAGEVVTHEGRPVQTLFFSTSGGHTENVEFSFVGALPKPWLRGVEDPFDKVSPRHRWQVRMGLGEVRRRLGGLVKGGFRGIKVVKRGASPRVVRAEVVGTRGRTTVTGPELRRRLGLFDTWARFTVVTTRARKARPQGDSSSGGASAARAEGRWVFTGRVSSARRGRWLRIERRTSRGWRTATWAPAGRGGYFRASLRQRGTYRVRHGDLRGPAVRVR